MTKPVSPRVAIAMKCKDCIYDPLSPGTWRAQVAECSSTNCPLHAFRPGPINARKGAAASSDEGLPANDADCASPAENSAFPAQSKTNEEAA